MRIKTSIAVFSIALFCATALAGVSVRAGALVDFVNPFIGTGGEGFGVGSTYPGPQTPFGMVKPGPDTTLGDSAPNFNHCSGYYYKDKSIRGFSHTRMHGTGVPGYGNIMIMPAFGNPADMVNEAAYRAPLDHSTEKAAPGYYAISLPDRGTRVEITTGDYTAHHKYTFDSPAATPLLIVNATYFFGSGRAMDSSVSVNSANNEASGWFLYDSPLGGPIKTYFSIVTNRKFEKSGTWEGEKYTDAKADSGGVKSGAVLTFGPGASLETKVAISFISVDQARANMTADHPDWDFDALRSRTVAAWEKLLGRIHVEGATEKHKRMFYTALYHSMQMPTLFSEAGGKYLGFDGQVHTADGFRYYTDFSMWDTFRSLHPLLVMILPEYQRDMMVSLTKIAEQGGWLPKWPVATNYTGCMIGTPADIIIADSYLRGVSDFDVKLAYENMKKIANGPTNGKYEGREDIESYMKYGFHPADVNDSSVSKTLEFAFNDFAISRLAAALGYKEDEKYFLERSRSYQKAWNPEVDFMSGRNADGSFPKNFIDNAWSDLYTEGTAWQWSWFVPHDVPGLIELFGGRETFLAKLDDFFGRSHREPDTMMYDKYYWHGNEPDIHAAYLYLWAGRPDRTQEEARWIMRKKYDDAPDGLDGNDDGGTLSAWYVFNAMGFFPIPTTNRYFIGSPIFSKSVIEVGGRKFTIEAPESSPKALYVKSAAIDSAPLDRPYFTETEFKTKETLKLEMDEAPGGWGRDMK